MPPNDSLPVVVLLLVSIEYPVTTGSPLLSYSIFCVLELPEVSISLFTWLVGSPSEL